MRECHHCGGYLRNPTITEPDKCELCRKGIRGFAPGRVIYFEETEDAQRTPAQR